MQRSTEPCTLRGRLFRPNAASYRAASITLQPGGSLLLDDGETTRDLPPGSLRWSSRMGETARRATLPDGFVFETDDNDHVDTLERTFGRRSVGLWHRLENLGAPLLALAVLGVLGFFIGLRWTVPWFADAASRLVPQAVEARLGGAAMDTLDSVALHPSELPAKKQRAILAVFDELSSHADTKSGTLKLAFRRGDKLVGANAIALLGGQIIVTDELADLAQTPDALAGVLAHEIAHVELRHGIRRLARVAGLSAVVMLMTGDLSSMTHDMGVLGAGLFDLGYSRGFERDADARGAALMRQANRDPETLAVLLEKLSERSASGGPSWLSSHPRTEERVQWIREGR
ncbi:M48 family metalloprotease [Bordetella sp. 02P26C-1]|uniref:M48 family metalloprotease n=1 Tax=Bordetella sp. 02P26C-1 TaxID=2683195 RepID=UPI001353F2E8|nr:M48 family metalloprotease [Bordetella sp. 02P26C-1]